MATKFQMGNRDALKNAVNKSISKKKKEDEKSKKQAVNTKQNEVATRKAQQPIYNITSNNSGLKENQIAKNLQAARNAVEYNKQAINQYKESKGFTTNPLIAMQKDTLLRKPQNNKMTPISNNRNAWEASPQNASQILQNKIQKEKEIMSTEEGETLQNNLRQAKTTAAYENYNYNQKRLENYKGGGFLDNTIGSFIRGASSLFDNMDEENFVYDKDGNYRKLASYSDLKQQKNQENQNFMGRIVSSTFNNLGKVLGAAAIDTATMGVGGKAIYWGDVYLDSYNQNLNDGYDEGSSATSALLTTGLGAVIDKLLGSAAVNVVGNSEATGLEDVISKFLSDKNVNKTLSKYISSMSSEGLSEFIEEYADAYINKFTLDQSTDPQEYINLILETFPAALESGLVGSLSGGIGTGKEQIQSSKQYKALNKYINTLENFTPTTVTEANMKEEALSDALYQRDNLEQEWGFNQQENKQETTKEMEQTALKAIEEKKNRTALNTTEQQEQVIEQHVEKTISKEEPTVKMPETKDTSKKYNIPDVKSPDVFVAKLTENQTAKGKEQTEQVLAEPGKNKTVTKFDDGTTLTTPSENTREGGIEAASKYMKDSISDREFKEIQLENKKRRGAYDNLEKMYDSQGNETMVKYIQDIKNNDLYTVEHSSYKIFNETINLLEDPETYYKNYTNSLEKIDTKNIDEVKKLEYKQVAMLRYFGDMESPGYNPSIAADIATGFAQEGTNIAQAMATRRQMYNNSPQQVAIRTQQTMNSLFREEAKNHEGDVDWFNKNDPMKNPKSPYKMSDTQFATVNYYSNELDNIKDKTSTEYLKTFSKLNNYIQTLFGDKKLTDKVKRLTITNVLASTRIWTQNIKGNLVNLAQFNGVDKLIATTADKLISNKSKIRTVGMSFEGDVIQGIKGYNQGIADSFYELKNDISISKFHSKYTDKSDTDISNLGKKSFGKTFNDNTLVGKALNRYQDFVNFALDMGDRPFANMYYEQSIYNQRMLNAQINAKNKSENIIYNTNFNDKTNMYQVRYFDENGKKVTTLMDEKQYNEFSKNAKVQEITEQMCNIAEKEALEKTYQDDNKITRAALKMKESLNEVFHVGDYGFGDMILKFTRTGSNMAKAVYEHSPLEAIQLAKDYAALKRNEKANVKGAELSALQHKVASEAGKMFGGAITMAIIGALNWSGLVKIEPEHDDKKGDKFKEGTMGSQEFSFKLPGDNYTYKISNDSTIGSLSRLGVTAEQLYKETNSIVDTILNLKNPFINTLIDNSFMSTVLDLGSTYSDPIDNLSRKIASQPSNLIPSMLKDFSYAFDNYTQRNTYDENLGQYMINQIINKTPLRSTKLTPKTTAWGDVKTVGGDLLASQWNTWLTGDTLSKIKDDKISNEVVRVYTETNNSNAIPNLNTTKNFKYNGQQFDLTDKEQSKYMSTYGKTAYDSVGKLMNTNQYKNANDEQKAKLLDKAYDYAKEKANQSYLEGRGIPYNNYNKKDGKYIEYKKPVFEEIIENDISIEDANYKRKYNNSYKLKTSITGLQNYQNIVKDIKEIKEAYSDEPYKTRKYAIQTYINELNGLNSVQKAMLSKLENSQSDYADYDEKILSYIKSLDLTDEEYQYMYKQLGLGGYWAMYYKDKTNTTKKKKNK